MRLALAEYGVDAYPLVTDGDFPSNLHFLPGVESVLVYGRDELPAYDMLCLIDCADRRRLGYFAKDDPSRLDGRPPHRQYRPPHHQRSLRDVNIVEPGGIVIGEIVAEVLKLWANRDDPEHGPQPAGWHLRRHARLAHSLDHPHTIRTVAELVECGAELEPVATNYFA